MISRKMLTQTATAAEVTLDEDHAETVGTEYQLENVRIVRKFMRALTSEGFVTQLGTVLYFDPSVSSPADFVPVVGMRVEKDGVYFTVKSVNVCARDDDTDFYEVELI